MARIDELKKRIDECVSHWGTQLAAVKEDLKFSNGDQWDDGALKYRRSKARPAAVINMTRAYCDRVVNPLRMSPIEIKISLQDRAISDLINGVMRGIQRDSGGSEYSANALENAVQSGFGYFKIAVEKEYGKKGYNVVRIKRICDPTTVLFDPFSVELDGSDAEFAIEYSFVDKDKAVEEYGEDAGKDITIHPQFVPPDGRVIEIIYHEIIDHENGYALRITRFVGQHECESATYPVHTLDIIPVYGERIFQDDQGLYYAGITRRVKDAQKSVNLYASNAMDLAGKATKSPYIIPFGSIDNFESQWSSSNTEDHAFLYYHPVDTSNNPVPPPQRADNSAQTQWLQGLQEQAQGVFGRVSGISDMMLAGGGSSAQEAMQTVTMRMSAAELSTAHYIKHLESSVRQLGRVICDMLPIVYNTDRPITVIDNIGRAARVVVNLKSIITDDVRDILHVDVDGGPSMENRKREAIEQFKGVLALDPTSVPKVFTQLVDMLDLPNGTEIVKALGGGEQEQGEEDPMAMQALQSAQQTIDQQSEVIKYYEGIIGQQQSQLLSSREDNETKILIEQMKSQTALMKEFLSQRGKLETEEAKAAVSGFDHELEEEKEEGEESAAPRLPMAAITRAENIKEESYNG